MQKIDSRKLVLVMLSLLIMVVVALLIGRLTYAFMAPDIDEDTSNQGEVTASGDTLIFSKGNDISLVATTDNFGTGKGNLSRTTNPSVRLVANSKTQNANSTYFVGIIISNNTYKYTTETNSAELILTVRDETGNIITNSSDELTYVTVGGVSGFDITGKTGIFNIVSDKSITTTSSTSGTTHTWTFTLTLVNKENDQSLNENASIDIEVILQKEKIGKTFVKQIKDTFTKQGENNLYFHNESLANGARDNSYRYAGSYDATNNWICFGYEDSTKNHNDGWCPNDYLYRIIGVFNEKNVNTGLQEEKVKLIRNEYADESILNMAPYGYSDQSGNPKVDYNTAVYPWSGSISVESNNWKTSTLNTQALNGGYLTYLNEKWTNKIDDTEWKIGGNTYANIINADVPTAYQNEVANPATTTIETKKIGLMYVTDYGYAASPENWTTKLLNYNNETNTNNNWLSRDVIELMITPISDSNNYVFLLNNNGLINFSYGSYSFSIRPSFYLKSNVIYGGGKGTRVSPYYLFNE